MAEAGTPAPRTPWHLWVIGGLSVLWNAVGALDFTMTELRSAAYLKAFTAEQKEYFLSFPLWVVLAWGIATWGSVLGSLLLLLRRAPAYHAFVASFVAMLLTMLHNYFLSDGLKVMGGGLGPVIFSAVIVIVGLLLLVYARAIRKRGVLR